MRIARFLERSTSRPRIGLERDGIIYDVEALEAALGAAVEVPGDPWDFHTRVAALSCAGLRELDAALLQGKRPASAVVPRDGVAALPPCDTDRALYVHVDVGARGGEPAVRLGAARSIAGQDALVDLPRGERDPAVEVGVAIVVGDDLRDATAREARSAILGVSVLADWRARDTEKSAPFGATVRGLRAQMGPVLAGIATVPKPGSLAVSVTTRGAAHALGTLGDLGLSLEDAVALASTHFDLRAGDVVGVAPVPFRVTGTRDLGVGYHELVEVAVERIGTLRGTAVERR
ncbi:MAG: fumarylacetoacetate hydrolase family protein [Polyangiaceae bacterium]|nr:fumarylacetoacetate hydrolase family protein [Polyangiaceae bacterium]